jgi:hypothetical protein
MNTKHMSICTNWKGVNDFFHHFVWGEADGWLPITTWVHVFFFSFSLGQCGWLPWGVRGC